MSVPMFQSLFSFRRNNGRREPHGATSAASPSDISPYSGPRSFGPQGTHDRMKEEAAASKAAARKNRHWFGLFKSSADEAVDPLPARRSGTAGRDLRGGETPVRTSCVNVKRSSTSSTQSHGSHPGSRNLIGPKSTPVSPAVPTKGPGGSMGLKAQVSRSGSVMSASTASDLEGGHQLRGGTGYTAFGSASSLESDKNVSILGSSFSSQHPHQSRGLPGGSYQTQGRRGSNSTVASSATGVGGRTDVSASLAGTGIKVRYPPSHTLIIFDWDDTLFPTSWLIGNFTNSKDTAKIARTLSKDARSRLRILEKQSLSMLQLAAELGKVRIVTHASTVWVKESAQDLMPELSRYLNTSGLSQHGIVACFDRYYLGLGGPTAEKSQWKRMAFNELLEKHLAHLPADEPRNLISIGDGIAEKLAAGHASDRMKALQLPHVKKTVKFVEDDCRLDTLTRQLRLIHNVMHLTVQQPESLDLTLRFCAKTGTLAVDREAFPAWFPLVSTHQPPPPSRSLSHPPPPSPDNGSNSKAAEEVEKTLSTLEAVHADRAVDGTSPSAQGQNTKRLSGTSPLTQQTKPPARERGWSTHETAAGPRKPGRPSVQRVPAPVGASGRDRERDSALSPEANRRSSSVGHHHRRPTSPSPSRGGPKPRRESQQEPSPSPARPSKVTSPTSVAASSGSPKVDPREREKNPTRAERIREAEHNREQRSSQHHPAGSHAPHSSPSYHPQRSAAGGAVMPLHSFPAASQQQQQVSSGSSTVASVGISGGGLGVSRAIPTTQMPSPGGIQLNSFPVQPTAVPRYFAGVGGHSPSAGAGGAAGTGVVPVSRSSTLSDAGLMQVAETLRWDDSEVSPLAQR